MNWILLAGMAICGYILYTRLLPQYMRAQGELPSDELLADAQALVHLITRGHNPMPRLQSMERKHGLAYCRNAADLAHRLDHRIKITFRPLADQFDSPQALEQYLTARGGSFTDDTWSATKESNDEPPSP